MVIAFRHRGSTRQMLGFLSLAFFLQANAFFAQADTVAWIESLSTRKENRDFLAERAAAAADFLTNGMRAGLFLTTGSIRKMGRLIISHTKTGSLDSCSGIAIDPSTFLTAAHCVCTSPITEGSAACGPESSDLSFHVFFPHAGLFEVKERPVTHPAYVWPGSLKPSAIGDLGPVSAAVADLAIVKFAGHLQDGPFPEIGAGSGKYVFASTGTLYFTIKEYAERMGFPIGEALAAGVGQVSKLQGLHKERGTCGTLHSADTVCSFYNHEPVEDGPMQSTTVCGGDSGAPVLQWAADGSWKLIAIASYFSPPNKFDNCSGDASRRAHYVDVSLYKDWVSKFVSEIIIAPEQVCVDGIFKKGTLDFLSFSGRVSATSFNKDKNNSARTEIVAEAAKCRSEQRAGVISCQISDPSYTAVLIKSDFAQLTFCKGS